MPALWVTEIPGPHATVPHGHRPNWRTFLYTEMGGVRLRLRWMPDGWRVAEPNLESRWSAPVEWIPLTTGTPVV